MPPDTNELRLDVPRNMSNNVLDMSRNELPRLSSKEANVIAQLMKRDLYGLELVAGSEGVLARNAIYVLLGRMEDKGLIEGREEAAPKGASGPPRRVYRVTGHGRRALAAYEVWTRALGRLR